MYKMVLSVLVVAALFSCEKIDDNNGNNTNSSNNTTGNNTDCGNDVREGNESCDGVDLNGKTCLALGYEGGELACRPNCGFDFSGCIEACVDQCAEGEARCTVETIETCELGENNCYEWVVGENCAVTGQMCDLSTDPPSCVACYDTCTESGKVRCNGSNVESCDLSPEGCLEWTVVETCADTGLTCIVESEVPQCGECTNGCTPNSYRCDGTFIQYCEVQPDGCYGWSNQSDCGAAGEACDDSTFPPACVTCVDQCDAEGQSRCSGDTIETCEEGADGCLIWNFSEDCSFSSQLCEDHTGTALCTTTCSNACSPAGITQCDGDTVEVCELQGDGCRDWVPLEECTSSGMECDDTSGSPTCVYNCVDECTSYGSTQCSGDLIEECAEEFNGCYYWITYEDCGASGFICDNTSGSPTCAANCSHECASYGDARCHNNAVEECAEDANGCRYWSVLSDCASMGQTCDETSGYPTCAGTCTDACPNDGDTLCFTDEVRLCTTGSSGCLEWLSDENCADSGQVCHQQSPTVASCQTACTNTCTTLGETRCDGDMLQVCNIDSVTGCYSWEDNYDCAADLMTCDYQTAIGMYMCM